MEHVKCNIQFSEGDSGEGEMLGGVYGKGSVVEALDALVRALEGRSMGLG